MSMPAKCEVCHKHKMCMRVGTYLVCILCINIYNEVKTMVIEAHGSPRKGGTNIGVVSHA